MAGKITIALSLQLTLHPKGVGALYIFNTDTGNCGLESSWIKLIHECYNCHIPVLYHKLYTFRGCSAIWGIRNCKIHKFLPSLFQSEDVWNYQQTLCKVIYCIMTSEWKCWSKISTFHLHCTSPQHQWHHSSHCTALHKKYISRINCKFLTQKVLMEFTISWSGSSTLSMPHSQVTILCGYYVLTKLDFGFRKNYMVIVCKLLCKFVWLWWRIHNAKILCKLFLDPM